MPAPAVIPALIAYVKVVAVKTLVVGFRSSEARLVASGLCPRKGVRLGRGSGGRRSIVPSGVPWFTPWITGLSGRPGLGWDPVSLALGTIYHD